MGRSRAGRIVMVVAALAVVGLLTGALYLFFQNAADTPQTTFQPASDHASRVQDVYVLIFVLAGVVFFAIMALTLIFSLLYRERPGQVARQFHGNPQLEVVWTLIPVLIVVVMAVPTFATIHDTTGAAPDNALQVTVIGHQWWWEFQYPELGVTTANELHLPVDRPVNFTIESLDVIHSFWVPQLSGKVDAVPGHKNLLWFTPNQARPEPYLGQCAEFCGASHANMRFRVFVVAPGEFDSWAKATAGDRIAPATDLAKAGEQQFTASGCVGCHTVQGNPTAVGKVGPDLTHFASRTTLAAGALDNTPENLRTWLRDPQAIKPNAVMPNLHLSPDALDKLVPYLAGLK